MSTKASTADVIASIALEILERDGPQAVTMRAVAAEAGITPMAIYHHFASREELLRAITDQEFDRLLGFMQERARSRKARKNQRSMLAEVLNGYVDYALARPRVFDYVFCRDRAGARKFPGDFRARKSPTINVAMDAVEAAMAAGELRKGDSLEIAFELWAIVHGYLSLYRAGRFETSVDEFRRICDRAIERLFDGLAP